MFSNGKEYSPEVTQIITYKGELKTADGTTYEMIVNEVPGSHSHSAERAWSNIDYSGDHAICINLANLPVRRSYKQTTR